MKKSFSQSLLRASQLATALCLISSVSFAQSSGSSGTSSSAVSSSTTSSDQLKWGDKRFVKKVAEGGQLEIAMADLAATRASNPDVRSYAQQLATDHRQMCRQLEQLAQTKGLQNEVAEYSVKMLHPGMAAVDRSRAGTLSAGSSEYDTGNAMGASGTTASSTSDTNTTGQTNTTDWNDPTKDRHYKRLAAKTGADFDKEYISMMVSDHEDDITMFTKESKKADDTDVRSFAQGSLPTLQAHLSRAQQIATAVGS